MSDDGTIVQYRIYCETEAAWKYVFLPIGSNAPTVCPTNTAHAVTEQSVDEVSRITPNVVSIDENTKGTNGFYQCTTQSWDNPPNQTTIYDVSFPFPISAFSMDYTSTEENTGDCVSVVVAPNAVVGALTADAAAGSTTFHVSPTVVQYVYRGFDVNITDGQHLDVLDRVLAVNTVTNTITTETASTHAYAASSPTYVRMNRTVVRNLEFGPPSTRSVGDRKIGGTHIPAGITVRSYYTNKSLTATKRMVAVIQFCY